MTAAAALGVTAILRSPNLRRSKEHGIALLPDAFVRGLRSGVQGNEAAVSAASKGLRLHGDGWSQVPSVLAQIGRHSFDNALTVIRCGCQDDYQAGRTLLVVGWVLSRTEAELIALAARLADDLADGFQRRAFE